jgi:hypothetical protein
MYLIIAGSDRILTFAAGRNLVITGFSLPHPERHDHFWSENRLILLTADFGELI